MVATTNSDSNNTTNEANNFSLDAILEQIGQFGKFQFMIYLLICIPMIFDAVFTVGYFFFAGTVAYRCRVPECEGSNSAFQHFTAEFSIPKTVGGDFDKCHRFVPYNRSEDQSFCYSQNFDQTSTEECGTDFIFRDEELTIANDFNIYCSDEWKLSLAGSVNNFGQFFGIPLGGYLSDRYGRRTVLAIGGSLSGIVGIVRSFSPDYITFLLLGFLDNLCGSTLYPTVFIIGIELVGPKARVIACSVMTMFYVFGEVILALVAKSVQNWRLIMITFYIPALAHISLLWLLPESVRWLLSKGEEDKATSILKRVARVNKRELCDQSIDKLLLANRENLAKANDGKLPIRKSFNTFLWRIVSCSFCWFTHVLLYYGLGLNAILFAGDKFDNFIYSALVEIPGLILPYFVMDRIGRRLSLFGCLMICGTSVASTLAVKPDMFVLKLCLFLLGKMAVSASFLVLYFFTSEMFPTNVRNSLLSFCSMVGRLGSILAPQTVLMAAYFPPAPAILFSGCAFISGFMALSFPETKDAVLPTTTLEAEGIGQKQQTDVPETPSRIPPTNNNTTSFS